MNALFELVEDLLGPYLQAGTGNWWVTPLAPAESNPLRHEIISAINPSRTAAYDRVPHPDPFIASTERFIDNAFDYLEFLSVPVAAAMIALILLMIVMIAGLLRAESGGGGENNNTTTHMQQSRAAAAGPSSSHRLPRDSILNTGAFKQANGVGGSTSQQTTKNEQRFLSVYSESYGNGRSCENHNAHLVTLGAYLAAQEQALPRLMCQQRSVNDALLQQLHMFGSRADILLEFFHALTSRQSLRSSSRKCGRQSEPSCTTATEQPSRQLLKMLHTSYFQQHPKSTEGSETTTTQQQNLCRPPVLLLLLQRALSDVLGSSDSNNQQEEKNGSGSLLQLRWELADPVQSTSPGGARALQLHSPCLSTLSGASAVLPQENNTNSKVFRVSAMVDFPSAHRVPCSVDFVVIPDTTTNTNNNSSSVASAVFASPHTVSVTDFRFMVSADRHDASIAQALSNNKLPYYCYDSYSSTSTSSTTRNGFNANATATATEEAGTAGQQEDDEEKDLFRAGWSAYGETFLRLLLLVEEKKNSDDGDMEGHGNTDGGIEGTAENVSSSSSSPASSFALAMSMMNDTLRSKYEGSFGRCGTTKQQQQQQSNKLTKIREHYAVLATESVNSKSDHGDEHATKITANNSRPMSDFEPTLHFVFVGGRVASLVSDDDTTTQNNSSSPAVIKLSYDIVAVRSNVDHSIDDDLLDDSIIGGVELSVAIETDFVQADSTYSEYDTTTNRPQQQQQQQHVRDHFRAVVQGFAFY